MKLLKLATLAAFAASALVANAQFAGAPFFLSGPTSSAPGVVVNSLVVSPTPTGMVVTGSYSVTFPAGTWAGSLLQFTVARPMQVPAWGPLLINDITIPGTDFIANPAGNLSALGVIYSSVDAGPGSSITTGLWPNSGPGINFYNGGFGYAITSAPFLYTGGAGNFLRMTYDLDFNYSGAGGTYNFIFPLSSGLRSVPEPGTIAVLGLGVVAILRRRRKSA